MYRSTLCSYFHIILLNIMQIKFKHILLFVTICFLIYLDYNWYLNTDFTLNENENLENNAGLFIVIHAMLGFITFIYLMLFTNLEYYIIKLLNKNIFKL